MRRSPLFLGLPRHGAFYAGAAAGLVTFAACLLVDSAYAVTLGASAMFVTYLVLVALEFPSLTPGYLRKRADVADAPVGAIFAVTGLVVGVAAFFLFLALNDGPATEPVSIAVSGASVLLGWFTVHTMAALHYAYEYYQVPQATEHGRKVVGGLEFPSEGEAPDGSAFLYFAYVIGMTAQVADVAVSSNAMRRLVTIHGVFSFFFNTVILAATVNVVVTIAGG